MASCGLGSLDVALKLVDDHHFPPHIRHKVRWWRKLIYKTIQYSRTNRVVWEKYILGYWSPLPRSDPSKMNLCSYKRFVYEAYVWRMTSFITILTWMKIKTVIFQMANSVTVLEFHNLLLLLWKRGKMWNSWRWTVMKESNTLKLNGLWEIWNIKGNLLIISKTYFVLVVDKLFPRSDDELGKCKAKFFTCVYNCCFIGY